MPARIKPALTIQGRDSEVARRPIILESDEARDEIAAALEWAGLEVGAID